MSASRLEWPMRIAGVVGRPIAHSLSPLIHSAWIEGLALNAAYIPLSPEETRFLPLIEGFRGGVILGLNVTIPFKETALLVADVKSPEAGSAGAANLLLFRKDGRVEARNTDGEGLLYALALRAPSLQLRGAKVALLGAGGAARGAAATCLAAGAEMVCVVNRTFERAERLARAFSGVRAVDLTRQAEALDGAALVINAAAAELAGDRRPPLDLTRAASGAAALDMVYTPLRTQFLSEAQAAGLIPVDGLDMLIGQAIPSFRHFFGVAPPSSVDVRRLALRQLGISP